MESLRIPYKNDVFGNPIFAKVCWSNDAPHKAKPIVIIYHGGGLLVGSSEMIPKPQINWLVSHGFLVVIPNYRLSPQVVAKDAIQDSEEAYDWAISTLPQTMEIEHKVKVDVSSVVSMGHSSGGTLALHLATCKPVKAVAAFYPSLYAADPSNSSHKPTNVPPFNLVQDYDPTEEDMAQIKPSDKQISEAALAPPGTIPAPRNKWQLSTLKQGKWMSTVCPDGDYKAFDPLTRLNSAWPPVMFVQGDMDNVPGSSLDLVRRAEQEIKAADVKVEVVVVKNAIHMFDLPPVVGTSDLGPKWEAVVKGLQHLKDHA